MAEARAIDGSSAVTLDDRAFGAPFNGPLVHESVRAELNARRQGTAKAKTRGEVRGGGAKPWRQKGTGRARAGSSRSPIWTGGGTIFGPQPRHYTFKINRKERRAALRSALSLHASRDSIAVVDAAGFDAPSTKRAAGLLRDWDPARPTRSSGRRPAHPVLLVLTDTEREAALSFRNLERVAVLPPDAVGVADLLRAAAVLASPAALEELTNRATSAGRTTTQEVNA